MASIAKLLKSEIARLERDEIKSEITSLRKRAGDAQTLIAALSRRIENLERQSQKTLRATASRPAHPRDSDGDSESESDNDNDNDSQGGNDKESDKTSAKLRFSVKGFAAQRKRLGLTAEEAGKLLNVSPLSIYKWESGKVKPRASHLQAIADFRKLGKRSAAQTLSKLKERD